MIDLKESTNPDIEFDVPSFGQDLLGYDNSQFSRNFLFFLGKAFICTTRLKI